MSSSLCGKVVHFSEDSTELQSESLTDRYGRAPNIYLCTTCTEFLSHDVYHVGYGYDAEKLPKRARRHRKQAGARKRKKRARKRWEWQDG